MRAVRVIDNAPQIVQIDAPTPAAGEVLVRVSAAGVNRADLLQTQGAYPPPPGITETLGLEACGEIVAVGQGVDAGRIGERVAVLLAGGGQAEYAVAPAGQAVVAPAELSDIEVAGLVETAVTVWSNLVDVARLQAGQTVLVHGGSSGIGTTAIQIATALGARVVVTVGSAEKARACVDLGAELAINYREQDFGEELKAAGIRPDVILDIIGAKYLGANVRALATGGRLVVIGLQGGVTGELNLNQLLMKRASVHATSLRARPVAEKEALMRSVADHLWPMVSSGALRPIIHAIVALEQVTRAHQVLSESHHIGKVVLTVPETDSAT